MKNNKDLDSWLKTEIKAFNSGERITKGEKINQRVKKMSKKIEKWSEEQLDEFVLPHPLLGKVTTREMLYFTIHHAGDHQLLI